MKKICLYLFLLLITFSCTKEEVKKEVSIDCNSAPVICSIADANNAFGIDIIRTLNNENPFENIFISPTSIGTALSMTLNGAKNQTLSDMKHTMYLDDLSMEEMNDAYKRILEVYPNLDEKVKLVLGNSIWPQEHYIFKDAFLNINKDKFLSEVNPVDFSDPVTITKVNAWIENHTSGLIKDAISVLPANVVMLLINTIYFKADWETSFEVEHTTKTNFYHEDFIPAVEVDMMHIQANDFPYFENEMMQAVDLPYGGGVYSMTVLLPKANFTTSHILNKIDLDHWKDWIQEFEEKEVELFMPRFKMEYDVKLKETLQQLGMSVAFNEGKADFTKMADGGLFIDNVIHKSVIEVDEKGTEAAAVTVVIIKENSVGEKPIVNLNKPFLFMIREQKTGSILFMGKMVNP